MILTLLKKGNELGLEKWLGFEKTENVGERLRGRQKENCFVNDNKIGLSREEILL